MFPKLLTVLAISASVLGQDPTDAIGCIVGGLPSNIESLPYQLSFRERNWHICGATIISPTWALTAAHCLTKKKLSQLSLNAGSTYKNVNGSVHSVKRTIIHPAYKHIDYDFGLVEVNDPFPLGQPGIESIELATVEPMEGDLAIISGWGALQFRGMAPDQLYVVNIPIMSRERCNKLYAKFYAITDRMLCAKTPKGGKDACQGDSGGPLVVNGQLAGVVSDGIGCGLKDFAGIYSNVANQLVWIRKYSGLS